MQDLPGSQDFPSGPQQWVEKDAKGVAWCLFSFRFVLLFFFLAVKDLNCAGSWVGGIERTCEGRGEQEPAEEGSSNANHRSASLPRSVCLSVSVLSCLKGGGLVP